MAVNGDNVNMSDYQDVLRRLAAYRKKIGATQKQVAEKLGLSQEQYSYLENGITKITDRNLKELLKTGWNIDYIITGTEFENNWTELDEIFGRFQDDELKEFVMKLLAEVLLEKGKKNSWAERDESAKQLLDLLGAIVNTWDSFSMTLFVREQLQLSQIIMAEKVGVGIKKYREIERENRYPDAEMLLSLYNMSGYQPVLFMNYYDRRILSIKQVWKMLTEEEKTQMITFVESIYMVL